MIDKKLIVEEGVIETGSEIKKSPDKSGLIIISNSIQGRMISENLKKNGNRMNVMCGAGAGRLFYGTET